jgi:hypothetical protein
VPRPPEPATVDNSVTRIAGAAGRGHIPPEDVSDALAVLGRQIGYGAEDAGLSDD